MHIKKKNSKSKYDREWKNEKFEGKGIFYCSNRDK